MIFGIYSQKITQYCALLGLKTYEIRLHCRYDCKYAQYTDQSMMGKMHSVFIR